MLVCGIDPGVTGAAVIIDDVACVVVAVLDMPVIRSGKVAWVDGCILSDWLEETRPELAILELVSAWAGPLNEGTAIQQQQRMTRIATLCRLAGGIEAVLSGLSIPFLHVSPASWLRRAGIPAGLTRAQRLERIPPLAAARLSWPQGTMALVKHQDRGAAGLIALYGRVPVRTAVPKVKRSKIVDRLAAARFPPGSLFNAG